jgi:hypothetical protein
MLFFSIRRRLQFVTALDLAEGRDPVLAAQRK